jgi:uncharacterized protein YegP (UPF0339 family)
MSRTKAELVKIGTEKYGITNAADMSYRQLDNNIRELRDQANPVKQKAPAPTRKAKAPVKRKPVSRAVPDLKLVDARTLGPAEPVNPQDTISKEELESMEAKNNRVSVGFGKTPYLGRVELRRGIARYYYVVKGGNGEITSTSQKYFSKGNAERAAIAVAKTMGYSYGAHT